MYELGADLPVLSKIGLAYADIFADVEAQPFYLGVAMQIPRDVFA